MSIFFLSIYNKKRAIFEELRIKNSEFRMQNACGMYVPRCGGSPLVVISRRPSGTFPTKGRYSVARICGVMTFPSGKVARA